jgi:hypothetical protein
VGYIRPRHHDGVSRLLAIGVPLSIATSEKVTIRILVIDPTDRAMWFSGAGP